MLEALDIIEHYCKILVEQSTQLEKPKYFHVPLFLLSWFLL